MIDPERWIDWNGRAGETTGRPGMGLG